MFTFLVMKKHLGLQKNYVMQVDIPSLQENVELV